MTPPAAAAKKTTPPRAAPEPYAAEAILTRPYPSTTLEARADRDAAVDRERVARDVGRRCVEREVSH